MTSFALDRWDDAKIAVLPTFQLFDATNMLRYNTQYYFGIGNLLWLL